MSEKTRDICDVISPVFVIWKYTSFPVYHLQARKFTTRKGVQPFCSLVLGLSLFLGLLYSYAREIHKINNDNVSLDMESVEICIRILYILTAISLSHKNSKLISSVPSQLLSNETFLERLTKVKMSYYSDVKTSFWCIILIKSVLIVSTCLIDNISFPEDRFNVNVYHFTFVFQFLSQITIILYFLILNEQYRTFNDYLENTDFESVRSCQISELIQMHWHFRQTVGLIKRAFEVDMFFKFLVDLSMAATGLFFVIEIQLVRTEFMEFICVILFIALTTIGSFSVPVIFEIIKGKVGSFVVFLYILYRIVVLGFQNCSSHFEQSVKKKNQNADFV